MKAVVFEKFGDPTQVLQVRDVPDPHPGPGEVRVRMILSPLNPSDLMVVEGRYGVLPTLPATPGFEGVGIVDEVGPGLLGRWVQGKRVVAINSQGGNWAEYAVIPARQARPVPHDIPDEQAAAYFVNPATVLAMVRHILAVPKGEWLLQSAAGSTLGRMVIALGKHDGFKTLNVVRRREAIDELKKLGGDAVISSSDAPIEEQVSRITGGKGVRFAIDPVGGQTGTQVFRSLGENGRLILYGTLSARTDRGRSAPGDLGTAVRRRLLARPLDAPALHPKSPAAVSRNRLVDSPASPLLGNRPHLSPPRNSSGGARSGNRRPTG